MGPRAKDTAARAPRPYGCADGQLQAGAVTLWLRHQYVSASCDALPMESRAVVETLEAVEASVAALAALVRRAANNSGSAAADPLRDQADACLDSLAEAARA